MLYALDVQTNLRRRPQKTGDRALCPDCGDMMQAKCGVIMPHHWAHTAISGCNGNWSGEMTDWHVNWQERFPEEQREIRISRDGINHRADVLTSNGIVIEFQHSYLSPFETAEREEFYQNIIWVTDDENAAFINSTKCLVFFDDQNTQTVRLLSDYNSLDRFSYQEFINLISLSSVENIFDKFILKIFSNIAKQEVFTGKLSLLELISKCQKLAQEKKLAKIEQERQAQEKREKEQLREQKAKEYKRWESQSPSWIKNLPEEDKWRLFEKWEKEQEKLRWEDERKRREEQERLKREEEKRWREKEKEKKDTQRYQILNSPKANRLRTSFKEIGYPICDKALLMLLTITPPETESRNIR